MNLTVALVMLSGAGLWFVRTHPHHRAAYPVAVVGMGLLLVAAVIFASGLYYDITR